MAVVYTKTDQSLVETVGTGAPIHTANKGDKYTDTSTGNTYIYTTSWQLVSTGAGGLTYFTEAQNTSAPNATVPVDSITAVSAATNADIAIVPKGTGALTGAIADNLTAGGNKRGQYAVDWQTIRNANTQVASGNRSIILGGYNNKSAGDYSITGGESNNVTGTHSVSLGASNSIAGNYSFAGGSSNNVAGASSASFGVSNTVSRDGAFATGTLNTVSTTGGYQLAMGYSNTASGNVAVALGFQNTASGSAAFATGQQSAASGINSVAVGRLNTASSTSSTAIGESNISSGAYSTAIGNSNITNGTRGLAFGYSNTSSNDNALCLGGVNTASATESVAVGNRNNATAAYSFAYGYYAHTFGIIGRKSYSSGIESTNGDAQYSKFILRNRTTDATTTIVSTDSATVAATTNQVILSNQSAYRFKGTIIGKQSGSTNTSAWDVDGLIVRGANAASTTLVVGNVNVVSNVPAWGTPALTADTTNGGLKVEVTGALATNIQWTAVIETTEVIYA